MGIILYQMEPRATQGLREEVLTCLARRKLATLTRTASLGESRENREEKRRRVRYVHQRKEQGLDQDQPPR